MRKLILFILLFTSISLISSQIPAGLKATLTQKGLTYAADVAISIAKEKLQTMNITDQHGEASSPIGDLEYWATNITVSNFEIPVHSAQMSSGAIEVAIKKLKCEVKLLWKYLKKSWPRLNDSGSAQVVISESNFSLKMGITEKEGKPHFEVLQSSSEFGKFDIKIKGGASWFYNLFKGIFVTQIKKAIENTLNNEVDRMLNDMVEMIPFEFPLIGPISVEYPLVADPVINAETMTFAVKGEIFNSENREKPSFPLKPIPNTVNRQKMAEILIGEYPLNTAGETYQKTGNMTFQLRDHHIPSWMPLRLHTSSFVEIVPELPKRYPNMEIAIDMKATNPPVASFTTQGGLVGARGELKWSVIQDSSLIHVFTLDTVISSSGKVWLKEGLDAIYFAGNLTLGKLQNSLKSSEIGNFDVAKLNSALNLIFDKVVIPAINEVLNNGFPLPTIPGLKLVSPTIYFGNEFVSVATDVKYEEPPIYSNVD
jgi:lipopolysaccharide-binding protein